MSLTLIKHCFYIFSLCILAPTRYKYLNSHLEEALGGEGFVALPAEGLLGAPVLGAAEAPLQLLPQQTAPAAALAAAAAVSASAGISSFLLLRNFEGLAPAAAAARALGLLVLTCGSCKNRA